MKIQVLSRGMFLLLLIVFARSADAQKNGHSSHSTTTRSQNNTILYVDEDSSVNPVQTRITYRSGAQQYDIRMAMDKVTELFVDNRKIAADSFYLYNAMVDKIKTQVKEDRIQAEQDRKQAVKDREQAEKDREQAEKDRNQAIKDRQQANADRLQADNDRKQAEQDRKQGQKNRDLSKHDMMEASERRKQSERDIIQANKDRQQAEENRKQGEADMKQAELDRAQAAEDRKQAVKDRDQAEIDRKRAEEDRALVRGLIHALVEDHIIASENELSELVLSSEKFIINGKGQPDELHSRYKAKFIKTPGISINYRSGNSYGISINTDHSK